MPLLEIPHKVCDCTCMVNGLEDLYEWKTGKRLSDYLFFYLSGMCGFTYVKQKKAPAPCMVFWGSNIKSQYAFLSELVGYKWEMTEARSFSFSLENAKRCIEHGTPAILGALDMYHIPYFQKFYHKYHIPIHYVMMVGYNDVEQQVFVNDCGKQEIQPIPYTDLEKAWNVNIAGLSKPNTFFTFEFDTKVSSIEDIVLNGLYKKAHFMLNPPVSLFGLTAMRKLSKDFPLWKENMDAQQYSKALYHFAEFTGNPPGTPAKLLNYKTDNYNNHLAGRDGFADLLIKLSQQYTYPAWKDAAQLFRESGDNIEKLTDLVVDYILDNSNSIIPISSQIVKIADLEEKAYKIIIDSLKGVAKISNL